MRKNRVISTFLIQGCFLALIAVLTPFGFYSNATQPLAEPTRTELVEQDRHQIQSVPDFQISSKTPEFIIAGADYVRSLAIQEQQVLQVLKQTSKHCIFSPVYYHKTTASTSSEDEPVSDSIFA